MGKQKWREISNLIHRVPDGAGQCGLKTCYQHVTGRGLSYARALQIIQGEQFLDALNGVGSRRMQQFRKKSGPVRNSVKRRRGRWRRQL